MALQRDVHTYLQSVESTRALFFQVHSAPLMMQRALVPVLEAAGHVPASSHGACIACLQAPECSCHDTCQLAACRSTQLRRSHTAPVQTVAQTHTKQLCGAMHAGRSQTLVRSQGTPFQQASASS